MHRLRSILGRILAVTGILLILTGLLWWAFLSKALVKYPTGLEYQVRTQGEVTRYSSLHGLEKLESPETVEFQGLISFASVDGEYTGSVAVVMEEVSAEPVPGLIPEALNTYSFDRWDCRGTDTGNYSSGGIPVDRSGTVYPAFPLQTPARSFEVYDNDTGSSFTVTFAGESERNGVRVLLFEGSFQEHPVLDYRVEHRGLPAVTTFGEIKKELDAAGIPVDRMIRLAYPRLTAGEIEIISSFTDEFPVRLEYYLSREWKAAVEPVSGTVVDVFEDRLEINVGADRRTFLPLLQVLARRATDPAVSNYLTQMEQQALLESGRLMDSYTRWSAESVEERASYAQSRVMPIRILKNYIIYALVLLGAACLVSGLLLRDNRHHLGPVIERLVHRHQEGNGGQGGSPGGDIG